MSRVRRSKRTQTDVELLTVAASLAQGGVVGVVVGVVGVVVVGGGVKAERRRTALDGSWSEPLKAWR